MKFFKKLKKGEIVIYALALMLVTAGYFNYTLNLENSSVETVSENNEINEESGIGDAKLVNSNDVVKDKKKEKKDAKKENSKNKEKVKNNSNNDYFINSKLERDKNYAEIISTYTKMIKDSSVSGTEKSIAMKEITKINNTRNTISICENLISTKGFKNYLIFVNDNSIDVVIESNGNLMVNKVAQIQNIVSREFNCDIEKIHITEK